MAIAEPNANLLIVQGFQGLWKFLGLVENHQGECERPDAMSEKNR
jgi:hypothetical protein